MEIIRDYMALHEIPELDKTLPKTAAYLTKSLISSGWTVTEPSDGSVAAFLDFGFSEAIAFRADMDALPITERTGLHYASTHPGVMHACGHDGHMAILLELARRFRTKPPKKSILLLFQPAEETDGGAKAICDSGILEQHRVRAVYGLHLWPGIPAGRIAGKAGPVMARSAGFTVRFSGKSVHAARAKMGCDALKTAALLVNAAHSSKKILLHFGTVQSGSAPNCVADKAVLSGTLRAFDAGRFCAAKKALQRTLDRVCRKTGCTADLCFSEGYPALCNPPGLFRQIRRKLPFTLLKDPVFTAEDFSFFLQKYPGLYFFLGVGDTAPLHSGSFAIDPQVLIAGADFLEQLASLIE